MKHHYLFPAIALLLSCSAADLPSAHSTLSPEPLNRDITRLSAPSDPQPASADQSPQNGDKTVRVEAAFTVGQECPNNMALVEGEYCSKPNHDQPQYDETGIGDPTCEVWKEKPCNMGGTLPSCRFARCMKYSPASSICLGSTVHKSFCMDQYEYTAPGETLPTTMVNFHQAKQICENNGKRLCTETEFEFACQGSENYPYSTGYERPDGICNIDVEKDLVRPGDVRIRKSLLVPSGSMKECRAKDTAVWDLNGNEDEITVRDRSLAPSSPKETGTHANALKGGWMGPVRNRCHPATTAHDDGYYNTITGFRCCANH
jgi:formylglycine-generating enzyme